MSLRFRRNYHLVVKLALFALVLVMVMGAVRITSYSLPDPAVCLFNCGGGVAAAQPLIQTVIIP